MPVDEPTEVMNPSQTDTRLGEVIAAYLRGLESETPISREALVAEHPELAGELKEFFANHDRIEQLAQPLRGEGNAHPGLVAPGATVRYFGDYELLDEIARGGMGVVYKSRQIKLNRLVAVKMILRGHLATEADVKRFQAEAQAAANLHHPGVVAIYEVDVHEGQHYYSMEYVEGQSLRELIRENPLPAAKAAHYVREMATIVEYAHSQGVLHRDLKPSNVLIDGSDHVRVTDFGLAKRVGGDSDLTMSGQVIGTPSYMPPEQAAAQHALIGPASDIYALGSILYELTTGRPPFRSDSAVETLRQVQQDDPVRPRLLNPQLSKDLETICLKCLEKEPRRRYATAQELADDLGRFERGEPITARPTGRLERAWRWCKRQPVVAGLSTAVALLLIAGTAVSTYFAVRESVERRQAEEKAALAQATSDFLGKDVLALTSVEGQYEQGTGELGRDATVRDLLDRAAQRIEGKFPDQPLVEAEIRMTIGHAYHQLREAQKAIIHLERCVSRFTDVYGENHGSTLDAQEALGVAYMSAGRLDDAISLLAITHERQTSLMGAEHYDALLSLGDLASAYELSGKNEQAIALYEEALRISTDKLGRVHRITLQCMANLAYAYNSAGRRGEAISLHERALKLKQDHTGPFHPDTLSSMNNLAVAYRDAPDLEKAVPLIEETLRLRREHLGPTDHQTLTTMYNCATIYRMVGRLPEALTMLQNVCALAKERLGPAHPDTFVFLGALAQAYEEDGRSTEALSMLEESLRLMREQLDPAHPNVLITMNNLAMAYQKANRLADAERQFKAQLEIELKGSGVVARVVCLENLASLYRTQKRHAEAVALCQEAWRLSSESLGPHTPESLSAMTGLVAAQHELGNQGVADKLLHDSIDEIKQQHGSDSISTALLLGQVGTGLLNENCHKDAESLLRECLRIHAQHGIDDWDACYARCKLGSALSAQGELAEAEELLLAAYTGMKSMRKAPQFAKLGLRHVLEELVSLYTQWEKPDEATKWRAELEALSEEPKTASDAAVSTASANTDSHERQAYEPTGALPTKGVTPVGE